MYLLLIYSAANTTHWYWGRDTCTVNVVAAWNLICIYKQWKHDLQNEQTQNVHFLNVKLLFTSNGTQGLRCTQCVRLNVFSFCRPSCYLILLLWNLCGSPRWYLHFQGVSHTLHTATSSLCSTPQIQMKTLHWDYQLALGHFLIVETWIKGPWIISSSSLLLSGVTYLKSLLDVAPQNSEIMYLQNALIIWSDALEY